jgi:hypothetical protein
MTKIRPGIDILFIWMGKAHIYLWEEREFRKSFKYLSCMKNLLWTTVFPETLHFPAHCLHFRSSGFIARPRPSSMHPPINLFTWMSFEPQKFDHGALLVPNIHWYLFVLQCFTMFDDVEFSMPEVYLSCGREEKISATSDLYIWISFDESWWNMPNLIIYRTFNISVDVDVDVDVDFMIMLISLRCQELPTRTE